MVSEIQDMDQSGIYNAMNTSELWNNTDELHNTSSIFNNFTLVNRTTSNSIIYRFYPIIIAEMILSIICLVLSIVIYNILPEFRNIHGKNLISLSSCLLTTFLLLCLDIILRLHISYSFCFTIAVAIHITFLATFFWTNVMAFDIWNNMTSIKQTNDRKNNSRKYAKYSAYAWTATVLTTLPAVILETTNLVVSPEYRPRFGVKRCWLSGTTAFIYYFNLPVGVILLGNLMMFTLTIRKLWIIKKETAILQVKQQKKRLNLYLKLFFVMGITWFTEFLPWVTKRYELYALAGILTALHGVFLFVIFILKKRVLRQLKAKINGGLADLKNTITQSTTSTNGLQSSNQNDEDTKT